MLSLKSVYGQYFFVITVKDTMEGKRDRCITRRTLRPIVPHSAKAASQRTYIDLLDVIKSKKNYLFDC